MILQELGTKLSEVEHAREAIERELKACRNRRTECIRQLEEARDLYAFRGSVWELFEELDEWTRWTAAKPASTAFECR